METFHWIVMGIALFFLIIILVLVGLMMRRNMSNKIKFPPVQQTCPDLWVNDGSGNCYYIDNNGGSGFVNTTTELSYKGDKAFPVYVKSKNAWKDSAGNPKSPSFVGSNPPSFILPTQNYAVFNPNDTLWSKNGVNPLCQQKKFANNNNIYWDGVSNSNQC